MTDVSRNTPKPTNLQRQCLMVLANGMSEFSTLPISKKTVWGPMVKFGWITQDGPALSITDAGKAALEGKPAAEPAPAQVPAEGADDATSAETCDTPAEAVSTETAPAEQSAIPVSEQIFRFIRARKSKGATDDEVSAALGVPAKIVSSRRAAMVGGGKVVNTGKTRTTRSGKQATVWIAG